MTLMYEITITIISPHNSDILKTAEEVIKGLYNKSEDLMIDIHICPAEVAEENE